MGFVQELKSGKLTIYAQFVAFIAVIVLLVNGISCIWAMVPLSIVGWAVAVVLSLVEFPIIQKGFKKGFLAISSRAGNLNSCKTRAVIYGLSIFIIVIFYTITSAVSYFTGSLVLLATNLILYFIAALRGEPLFRSCAFGSGNIEEQNPPQVPAPDI